MQIAAGLISLVSLVAVVWWALGQEPPPLPSSTAELAALGGAIAVYALATGLRAERWHRILLRDGATPTRGDSYALTLVGFMGNNVLPARGGDAMRVVFMAPRARTSMRAVIGSLVAERLLDVLTLLALFATMTYGILRGIDAPSSTSLLVALGVGAALAIIAVVALRLARNTDRGSRVIEFLRPLAAATTQLRGPHGAAMACVTLAIWGVEALTYLLVGGAVGLEMSFLEALYVIGVAGVFVLIPAGPGYLGTLDAAVIFATAAIGASGAESVAFVLTLRFVLFVPITLAGLVALLARYRGRPLPTGGLKAEGA
jgi:uncharacterized protein (TIRG00374 family)